MYYFKSNLNMMKHCFILLLISPLISLLILHVKCDQESYSGKFQTLATLSGSPELATAIQLLQTSSSSTIGPKTNQRGFYKLENTYDISKGATLKTNLNKLIKLWFTYEFKLSEKHKNIIGMSIEEYMLQLENERYEKRRFEIHFNNGHGSIFLLLIIMEPYLNNAVKWTKQILTSEFIIAPSYVIITNSDCDIFSCSREDSIVYLPTSITDEHTQMILNMTLNMTLMLNND